MPDAGCPSSSTRAPMVCRVCGLRTATGADTARRAAAPSAVAAPAGHLNDAITQSDGRIRYGLALGEALADELDHLGILRELTMVDGIPGLEASQIKHRDVRLVELRPVLFLIGVDRAQVSLAAPHPPRDRQRPAALRCEQGEGWSVRPRAHVDEGFPGEIDINIGGSEQDVVDFRCACPEWPFDVRSRGHANCPRSGPRSKSR